MVKTFGIDNVLSGVRALLAKELGELGYPQKEISEILGTSPAAVTLYSKDRRGLELSKIIRSDKNSHVVIDSLMESITQRKANAKGSDLQKDTFPLILDATYRIMRIVSSPTAGNVAPSIQDKPQRNHSGSPTDTLIDRLQEEQLAAERNMALAVGTTDEVARTIFRQIASDSIRHAEIISFILTHQKSDSKDKRKKRMIGEEIKQIEAMLESEDSATEKPINSRRMDQPLRLLLKSIDIDEEKHKILLSGLLSINKSKEL